MLAAVPAALWCSLADAATIVQNVSGTQNSPGSILGFDPLIGFPGLATLLSVQVEGTITTQLGVVRSNPLDLSAISASASGTGTLALSTIFVTTPMFGTESYAQGSLGGSMTLNGSIFSILTGSAVNQFYGSGPTQVFPNATFSPPLFGQLQRGGLISYAVTITYNYTVPEPATWTLMLLGFGAIGLVVRRKRCGNYAFS
jgi:hypothetical protein